MLKKSWISLSRIWKNKVTLKYYSKSKYRAVGRAKRGHKEKNWKLTDLRAISL